jgi:hypothetical protein
MNLLEYWYLWAISSFSILGEHIAGPFPQGTNVYATISVSFINTLFSGNAPDPTFATTAQISWFTTYLPDGTESSPQALPFGQSTAVIENVARINFQLFVQRAWAFAHMNVFAI